MAELLTQNGKMRKSRGNIWNFGIPALQSSTGRVTCPLAGSCAKYCYAQSGAYMFSNVKPAFEDRLAQSLTDTFIDDMKKAIDKRKNPTIRIHDSGDFYSAGYARKWLAIAWSRPSVLFYAYTKNVKWFQKHTHILPPNFRIIYSLGGLQDDLIDRNTDRHCRIFYSEQDLLDAGYVDSTEDDYIAATTDSNKIGLLIHGGKAKQFNG